LYTTGIAQNCTRTDYRSFDGTCNNLGINAQKWGGTHIPLHREVGYAYDVSDPYNMMLSDRPNPRAISNTIFSQSQSIPNSSDLSSFVFTWGQFIDHDIGITEEGNEKMTIPLPVDEPHFTVPMSFTRSDIYPGTGIFDPRTPSNDITAWIDASQVYGSDTERANWLRTKVNGKLKVSSGNLLPYNTLNGEASGTIDTLAPHMANPVMARGPHFVAGDVRAAEQPGLTVLHTLFVREHNRICDELLSTGYSTDEEIYQLARKKVGALIQSITYNEFLPALGIYLNPYFTYNPSARPDIMNEFSTAAFRIGHTMVTEELLVLKEDCSPLRDPLKLEEAFFNTRWLTEYGIEPFIKGLSSQLQEKIDAKIVDGLRNFLFNIPGLPGNFGLDLGALNIQRGRDHGLKDYNTIRAYFTGTRAFTFDQINSDPNVWQPLAKAYDNDINNIDPWVGMLAEEPLKGSAVGITIFHILKSQFEKIRDGDYYYYMNDPLFSSSDQEEISKTKLTDVIQRNSTLTTLAKNVFKVGKDNCHPTSGETTSIACGETTISYGNGSITMTGEVGKVYNFQVFDKRWRTIFSCGWDCGHTRSVSQLNKGNYKIIIYDSNWSIICFQDIDLKASSGPVDADGDGVLESLDCNDADPNLTLVDAACDDGNPNTTNDKVDANCMCMGTPTTTSHTLITCNSMSIGYGDGEIILSGVANSNYKYKVERVSPGWEFIDNCVTNCSSSTTYQNLIPGTYSVRVWSADWKPLCSQLFKLDNSLTDPSTERVTPQAVFANQQPDNYGSTLFPNPANTEVTLTLPHFVGQQGNILIYNNLGQAVQSIQVDAITESNITLDVQTLETGLYHVHVVIGEGIKLHHKLVIRR